MSAWILIVAWGSVQAAYPTSIRTNSITALRTAIEQALTPGEPVAWDQFKAKADEVFGWIVGLGGYEDAVRALFLLSTAPQPQPKQEPVAIVVDAYDTPGLQWLCQHPPERGDRLYTAPQPQPKQEPKRRVAYVCPVCAASLERQE
jgi:hypothetical protein